MRRLRRTKIVATLGPASSDQAMIARLFAAGAEPVIARDAETVLAADRLVLPGVGAAGAAAERLAVSGLRDALEDAVAQAREGVGRHGAPMCGAARAATSRRVRPSLSARAACGR